MNFNVGDKVRIKDWDVLEKEFGREGVHINTPGWRFGISRKPLCGEIRTIIKIDHTYHTPNGYIRLWLSKSELESQIYKHINLIWTSDMIEAIEIEDEFIFEISEWERILNG